MHAAVFKQTVLNHYFFSWPRIAVEEAAAIPSVSLRPLEGMEAVDVTEATSRARDGTALAALLKLCNGWQKPGATLQGQCILVSQTKFEVDIGYHVDVIAAFKQMPTKNYGNSGFIWLCLFFWQSLCFCGFWSQIFFVCGRHENKKVEFFTRGL